MCKQVKEESFEMKNFWSGSSTYPWNAMLTPLQGDNFIGHRRNSNLLSRVCNSTISKPSFCNYPPKRSANNEESAVVVEAVNPSLLESVIFVAESGEFCGWSWRVLLPGLQLSMETWESTGVTLPYLERLPPQLTLLERRNKWMWSGAVPQFVLMQALSTRGSFSEKLWTMLSFKSQARFSILLALLCIGFYLIFTPLYVFLYRLTNWPLCNSL